MFDVLCLGETAVDIITRPVTECSFSNKCSPIERISIQSGGDALNNAVDLAKLGNQVCYMGRIGTDVGGEFVLQELKNAGVNVSHVVRSKCPHTKVNVLIKRRRACVLLLCGTSLEFLASDVDRSLLPLCRILPGGRYISPAGFRWPGGSRTVSSCSKSWSGDIYGCHE